MTRDEHRAKCIEVMAEATYDEECGVGAWKELIASAIVNGLRRPTHFEKKYHNRATVALNSLHGIARVWPIEATEEMLEAGADMMIGLVSEGRESRNAMSAAIKIYAAGDLTNPPEKP